MSPHRTVTTGFRPDSWLFFDISRLIKGCLEKGEVAGGLQNGSQPFWAVHLLVTCSACCVVHPQKKRSSPGGVAIHANAHRIYIDKQNFKL